MNVDLAPTLATKRCSSCGETKPISAFYRHKHAKDGRTHECAACVRVKVDVSQARQRAEMGEEAWREHKRIAVAKSRAKTGNVTARRSQRARQRALETLAKHHPSQFAALLSRERYEAGL